MLLGVWEVGALKQMQGIDRADIGRDSNQLLSGAYGIWPMRTYLLRPVYLDLSIWTRLFRPVYFDPSI